MLKSVCKSYGGTRQILNFNMFVRQLWTDKSILKLNIYTKIWKSPGVSPQFATVNTYHTTITIKCNKKILNIAAKYRP